MFLQKFYNKFYSREQLIAQELELQAHRDETEQEQGPQLSFDIYREMSITSLKTYYIRSHKDFELFRTLINSYSYSDGPEIMTPELARFYKKRMRIRTQYIEDAIDLHLNAIGAL